MNYITTACRLWTACGGTNQNTGHPETEKKEAEHSHMVTLTAAQSRNAGIAAGRAQLRGANVCSMSTPASR